MILAAMVILPLDDMAAAKAADTERTLEAAGLGIGTADTLNLRVRLS